MIEFGFLGEPGDRLHCSKKDLMGCILLPAFQITLIDTFPLAQ